KPQPIGSFPFLLLFTTATLCALFVIWRRSDRLRTVVAHQLKTWTRQEGAVRLSEDDGPSASSFLEDEDLDDDSDELESAPRLPSAELQSMGRSRAEASADLGIPPAPPAKE
ncbi:hypothetical protein BC834DRAFT_827914, partial [Gloeopeniophorella convolvens]